MAGAWLAGQRSNWTWRQSRHCITVYSLASIAATTRYIRQKTEQCSKSREIRNTEFAGGRTGMRGGAWSDCENCVGMHGELCRTVWPWKHCWLYSAEQYSAVQCRQVYSSVRTHLLYSHLLADLHQASTTFSQTEDWLGISKNIISKHSTAQNTPGLNSSTAECVTLSCCGH